MSLIDKASRSVYKKSLMLKHNSPHIFFGLGVVGIGVSTFLACKSTLKVEPVVDNMKQEVDDVKARLNTGHISSTNEYNREMVYAYSRGTLELAKLYGPAVIVGGLSISALTGSHIQLARRNTALSMTLAALSKAYNEYRVRVQEEIGVERENDIYRGVSEQTFKGKDGEKITAKLVTSHNLSPYARCFDETSIHWTKNAEMNFDFIYIQQEILGIDLKNKGYLFLNDVYKALGFEETEAGQIVGWVYNSDTGDGYIDFGIYEARNVDFKNGIERSAWLDFNVDGPIIDILKEI